MSGPRRRPLPPRAVPLAAPRPDVRILALLTALALALALAPGCAAVGATLLGAAASTATKTGVSYTLDSRAHKTFTAPMADAKANLLKALDEMGFPVASTEKEEDGERIVAKVEEREVEVLLEPVTPKATKLKVIVREGWFWKDRATAEEIVEQTGRGLEETILVARRGRSRVPAAAAEVPPASEVRPALALLGPWEPQRWREGFAGGQAAAGPKLQGAGGAPAPGPAPPAAKVALGGGRAPGADVVRPPPTDGAAVPGTAPPPAGKPAADGHVAENPWRVLRNVRLRHCPGLECASGSLLQRGDVVVRLRTNDEWWRVWVAGTDVVGWVSPTDVAPQRWWDPPAWMNAASSR